jgi:hypothetical protein
MLLAELFWKCFAGSGQYKIEPPDDFRGFRASGMEVRDAEVEMSLGDFVGHAVEIRSAVFRNPVHVV